jgi:hypothetical protein
MCHHKMEKQTNNDKSVKTPMLPEPSGDNKSSPLRPQVQANHQLMPVNVNVNVGQQAPAAPAAPQQRRQDNLPCANRTRARDLLRDFERDGLEVYNSPQTNLGAALAAMNHLEDSLMV